MRKPALMIQGTGSNVGKSLIVAGLARALTRRGMAVRPFKPQNMSNNAGATDDGGEIGRAQILQAQAAGVAPSVHMNPVLLKPEAETGAQVIVQGKRLGTMSARDYTAQKSRFLAPVLDSLSQLEADADIILVEGAGSPAEINLRVGDIANMGFAQAADVPVVVVGDIDRGGVIASLVGTHAVLEPAERDRIRGFIVNRFRGDPGLFTEGSREIARRTGWADLGIVPHFADAALLPAEDSLALDEASDHALPEVTRTKIVVPRLKRIANFDDLDPLQHEPDVVVDIVEAGRALPGDADLILLPGSKSTIADLADLRRQGWDIDIAAHYRRGGHVLGICGGYQMLGTVIRDPSGIEGQVAEAPGLGLLNVETTLSPDKATRKVQAHHLATGRTVTGYEIHIGVTTGGDCNTPFATIDQQPEGAISVSGRVTGTYIHGLFADDRFRAAFLAGLGAQSALGYDRQIEATLDSLADHLETHLDIAAILEIANARAP
ncbi:MAG: cobyric acid synthase [Alphaproteobacteria bacterium]